MHTGVNKEIQKQLEQVAHNFILKAEAFMIKNKQSELAKKWIEAEIIPHKEGGK